MLFLRKELYLLIEFEEGCSSTGNMAELVREKGRKMNNFRDKVQHCYVIDAKLAKLAVGLACLVFLVMFIIIQIQKATIDIQNDNYELLLASNEAQQENNEIQAEIIGILETKLQDLEGGTITE